MAISGIEVSNRIQALISEVGKCRREIESKGLEKARTTALYDVKLGNAIQVLREEGKFPATLIEKIAKKLVADDREKMDAAEIMYKACLANLEALKAQMNAYQSVFRHLESI